MITVCDCYWWRLNKSHFIIMLCSLPFALIFPVLSLIFPMFFLYGACDKFLVFNCIGDKQDDSLRFIMTFPFSRKQIFNTYIKGLTMLSVTYTFAIYLIRFVFILIKLPIAVFWNGDINTGADLFNYMWLLFISLLITNLLLIWLVNCFTTTRKSVYIMIALFEPPVFCVLLFLKNVITFIIGLSKIKMNMEYGLEDIIKLGTGNIAAYIYSFILIFLIISLVVSLIIVIVNIRKKFVGRYKNEG